VPIFCQCFHSLNSYHDRLNCYLTRTFWKWTLLSWLAFKWCNSWTNPFRKWSISLYMYVRWTYKAWLLPKLSSQNIPFCHEEQAMSSSLPQFFPWSTHGTSGTMIPLLATNNGLHFMTWAFLWKPEWKTWPQWALNLSPQYGHVILCQWIPCFDRYQLIITWMSNIKDIPCKARLHVTVNL